MGLVFALQPDLRKSDAKTLVLRSSKRRFGLGGGFIFGGALLGTMFLAASPLFAVLWNEGNFFDKLLTLFFYCPIFIYPVLALACWFFEERVYLKIRPQPLPPRFDVIAYETVFGMKWNKRQALNVGIENLSIENWKGAVNMAAIDVDASGNPNRYATRGHWILKLRPQDGQPVIALERRAKRPDIEWLVAQIAEAIKPAQPSAAFL